MNFCVWLALLAELIFFSPSYANEKILIYTSNYEPYYGEKMAELGPVVKLSILAFKEAGYDTEVQSRPWARVLKEGEKGECDVIVGVWFNTGRENWMALSDTLLENENGFYKRKNDDLVFKGYADLKAKDVVIGTVRGYIDPEGFLQAGLRTEVVTEDLQNMKKLVAGHIRLALTDRILGAYLLKKEGRDNDIEWLVTLQKIPLRNGIMKNAKGDWEKKLHDFNEGLALLRSKGVIEQVMQEYQLQ
jgi:polar amino acid transport system substrate-binding protein